MALLGAEPSTFEARKAAIRALLAKSDFAAALEQAQAIQREWPDDVATYQLMAAAHLGLGNYADAEKAAQWMLDLRIGKTDARGWLLISNIREVTGDFEGASDAVNAAYAGVGPGQDADRVALLVRSGRLNVFMGKFDLAERVLRDALAIAPADQGAREALARLKSARGLQSEAIEIFKDLARLTGNPRYLYEAQAFAAFERAARERMGSTDNANRELALYYAGTGKRPAEALAIARREAERRHDVWTLDALAVAQQANGEIEEARATMKRVLAVGVRYPEVLQHAAKLGLQP
jgi:Flp pilus assembly protein TadD